MLLRKITLTVLFVCSLAGAASAQNTVCPTAPNGDSSNKCASTAFVQNAIAGVFPNPVPVSQGGTGDTSFTVNRPILGNGTSPLIQGTLSGNTTKFGTVSGSLISGNCLKADASGNIADAGAGCTVVSYPITVALGGTGTTSFTANLPILGNGTAALTQGSLSGNTTKFGTVSGVVTSNHCAQWDVSGNLVDSGAACPTYPIAVSLGGTGDTSFTANLPILGSGTSALTQGSVSGNTTKFGTVSGTLTAGHCAQWDASGNIVDSGGSCSTSAGVWTTSGSSIYNNNAGPVGILTNSPGTNLEVYLTGNNGTYADANGIRFWDGGNGWQIGENVSAYFQLWRVTLSTLSSPYLTVTTAGKIGNFYNSVPDGYLDVYGPNAAIGCCAPKAQIMNIAQGSSGTPVTVADTPGVIISRYEGTTGASGDSSSEPALLVWEQASGTNQPNAIIGRAVVAASGNADAVGVYGIGETNSTAGSGKTAYGSFFNAVSNYAGSHAVAIGTNVTNNTGLDDPDMYGIDLVYNSAQQGGAAALIRASSTGRWSNAIKVTSNLNSDAITFSGVSVNGNFINLPTTGLTIAGFGAASAGNQYLCFNTSNSQVTYNATACNPSDERLKSVEGGAPEGLGTVLRLKPVRFAWRDAAQAASSGPQIGLLAQDVAKLVPETVGTSEVSVSYVDIKGDKHTVDKPLNIDYAKLVVPLISAVQQLFYLICGLAVALIICLFGIVIWVRSVRKTGVLA